MISAFDAVPEGQRRYIDEEGTDPTLDKFKKGDVLEAQGGPFQNRFTSYILIKEPGQEDINSIQKRVFLRQPLDRRKQYSPEELEQIDDSESARNHHIFEISRRMDDERAETIIRAVLIALYDEANVLVDSPFRKKDTFEEAVIAVKAADLKGSLKVAHIPHTSKGSEKGPEAYRKNIRVAVASLMGVEDPQEQAELSALHPEHSPTA